MKLISTTICTAAGATLLSLLPIAVVNAQAPSGSAASSAQSSSSSTGTGTGTTNSSSGMGTASSTNNAAGTPAMTQTPAQSTDNASTTPGTTTTQTPPVSGTSGINQTPAMNGTLTPGGNQDTTGINQSPVTNQVPGAAGTTTMTPMPGTTINSNTLPGTYNGTSTGSMNNGMGTSTMPGNTTMSSSTYTPMSRISESTYDQDTMNRYGGPVYRGDPKDKLASTFLTAGGGPWAFSISQALREIIGQPKADDEISDLRNRFGTTRVARWMDVFDYSVVQASVIADELGKPSNPGYASLIGLLPRDTEPVYGEGYVLLGDLVSNGTDSQNNFHEGLLLDKLISHDVHSRVMADIDSKYGVAADADYHLITDQLMVDLGHMDGQNVHMPDTSEITADMNMSK